MTCNKCGARLTITDRGLCREDRITAGTSRPPVSKKGVGR